MRSLGGDASFGSPNRQSWVQANRPPGWHPTRAPVSASRERWVSHAAVSIERGGLSLEGAQRGPDLVDRVDDRPARRDRPADKEIHSASDDVLLPTALKAQISRDRDDPSVVGTTATHELGEHSDLARSAVIDHRPVEPRDECVGRAEPVRVHAIHLLDRDIRELGEILVRHEAVEAVGAQPRGELVEPGALGIGEERACKVKPHGAERYLRAAKPGPPGAVALRAV